MLFLLRSIFSKLDLPTLDLPMNAISKKVEFGQFEISELLFSKKACLIFNLQFFDRSVRTIKKAHELGSDGIL
mgnify:CR=1 FL=1